MRKLFMKRFLGYLYMTLEFVLGILGMALMVSPPFISLVMVAGFNRSPYWFLLVLLCFITVPAEIAFIEACEDHDRMRRYGGKKDELS